MQDELISPINMQTVYAKQTTAIRMDVNIFHSMHDFAPKCLGGLAKKVRRFGSKDAVLWL